MKSVSLSDALVNADKICDWVPVVSLINNLVDLIAKAILKVVYTPDEQKKLNKWSLHVLEKPALKSLGYCFPFGREIDLLINSKPQVTSVKPKLPEVKISPETREIFERLFINTKIDNLPVYENISTHLLIPEEMTHPIMWAIYKHITDGYEAPSICFKVKHTLSDEEIDQFVNRVPAQLIKNKEAKRQELKEQRTYEKVFSIFSDTRDEWRISEINQIYNLNDPAISPACPIISSRVQMVPEELAKVFERLSSLINKGFCIDRNGCRWDLAV